MEELARILSENEKQLSNSRAADILQAHSRLQNGWSG
jgi:hypothetical protein